MMFTMIGDSASATVPARAALAGNPSDGHGGSVVATTIPAWSATVRADEADRFSTTADARSYASITDLCESLDGEMFALRQPLAPAALVALHRRFGAELRPHRFTVTSTIPRSVGLAGSSAIVIATIDTMIQRHPGTDWGRLLAGRRDLVAGLALEAERDVLHIPAGLQDRVVQSLGGTVAMDFRPDHMMIDHGLEVGTYERLTVEPLRPVPVPLFVVSELTSGGDSGMVHGAIDPSDSVFRRAMARSADAARTAADAIRSGDVAGLASAMNATFDQRARAMPLDERHVAMVEIARSFGAAANFTGSGGSVVVLAPNQNARSALDRHGYTIVDI